MYVRMQVTWKHKDFIEQRPQMSFVWIYVTTNYPLVHVSSCDASSPVSPLLPSWGENINARSSFESVPTCEKVSPQVTAAEQSSSSGDALCDAEEKDFVG